MTDNADERAQNIRMIRDSAAAITGSPGDLQRIRALRFTKPGTDDATWQKMADLGWIGILVDESSDGIGLGMSEFLGLAEELGRALVPEPLIAVASIAPDLPADLLADTLTGALVVMPIWQELVGDASLSAVGENATLTGSADRVPSALCAHGFVVQTNDGSAYIAAKDCTIEPSDTLDGGTYSKVTFNAVHARPLGDLSMARERATLATAAYLLGAADRAFEMTLDYVKMRHQFGRAIGSFQVIQHRAVDMKLQLEITRAVLADCVAKFETEESLDARRMSVSRAKARASDTAMLISRHSTQMHGAVAITDEHDIGLYTRKIATLFNQYGTASTHRRRYDALSRTVAAMPSDQVA